MILRTLTSPLKQLILLSRPFLSLPRTLNAACTHLVRLPTYQSSSQPLTKKIRAPMSTISLTSLRYLSRETLASQIEPTGSLPANTAIIDVRDSDHVGGHIRGSTWVPSNELDYRVPELVRTLKDKEVVVFHCALSQQRGPSAALRYLKEKERLGGGGGDGGNDVGEGEKERESGESEKEEKKEQEIYVLRGGFTEWQEKYGADEKLTEGWVKDIWEFG